MIKFQNVTKSYENGVSSLYDVNFEISEGEFVFLIGPSGAGKTTALRLIIREDIPTSGEIVISSYNLTNMPKRYLPSLRRQIGVIFQDFKLLPGLTVAENISFILEVSGKTDKEIEETVQYLLNVVNLTDRAHLYPQQLSGGEQQRVAIARAIANDPAIVLADEPTGNLDPENAAQVMDLLRQINSWGTTVLISTHDPNFVNQYRSRVLALEKGRLIKDYVGDYLESLREDLEQMKTLAEHQAEKDMQSLDLTQVQKPKDFDEDKWEDLVQKNSEHLIYERDSLQEELDTLEDSSSKNAEEAKIKKTKKSSASKRADKPTKSKNKKKKTKQE